jgi:hypothetical protein
MRRYSGTAPPVLLGLVVLSAWTPAWSAVCEPHQFVVTIQAPKPGQVFKVDPTKKFTIDIQGRVSPLGCTLDPQNPPFLGYYVELRIDAVATRGIESDLAPLALKPKEHVPQSGQFSYPMDIEAPPAPTFRPTYGKWVVRGRLFTLFGTSTSKPDWVGAFGPAVTFTLAPPSPPAVTTPKTPAPSGPFPTPVPPVPPPPPVR